MDGTDTVNSTPALVTGLGGGNATMPTPYALIPPTPGTTYCHERSVPPVLQVNVAVWSMHSGPGFVRTLPAGTTSTAKTK